MNAEKYRKYLEKGAMENIPIHYENCSEDWVRDFQMTAKSMWKESNNIAIEYVQSWNPEESKRIGAEKLYALGVDTAREMYPDHQFVVVPQVSENGNYHNHILFCTVSHETGKRISSTYTERAKMNRLTDKRVLEFGLSTPDRGKVAREKLPRAAHDQRKRGRSPIDLQIMKSADIARSVATSFSDYGAILESLGIRLDDRGKVLTYHHPARKKGLRDRQIGSNYQKESLNERFAFNRKTYNERPELYSYLKGEISRLYDNRGNLVGDESQFPFAPGGHKIFERRHRVVKGELEPRHFEVGCYDSSLYPHARFLTGLIKAANEQSILEYCKQNRIALNANADGTHTLKGRENILIENNRWRNTRSVKRKPLNTQGQLLEFVANHRDISSLQALAHITGNNRVLVLEKFLEFEPVTYKEFHVPKHREAPEKTAISCLQNLAKVLGKNSKWSQAVLNSKRVQVTTEGVIRFLFGKDNNGAVEYKQSTSGQWDKKLLGVLKGGHLSQSGSSKTLHVFSDPFAFMEHTKGRGKMFFSSDENILVLGDSKDQSLDYFLVNQPHVKTVELIGFDSRTVSNELSLGLKAHNVSVSQRNLGSADRGKEKGLSIEI